MSAAAIRDSEAVARARAAKAELEAARTAYIHSHVGQPQADEDAMRRRIDRAEAGVEAALGSLLHCIDRQAGAR